MSDPTIRFTSEHLRELVICNRERRLAMGFDYDFGDARACIGSPRAIRTCAAGMRSPKVANAMLALGDISSSIGIVTEAEPVEVAAFEWQHVLVAAGTFCQPIWTASFALQAMDRSRTTSPTTGLDRDGRALMLSSRTLTS